MSTLEVTLIDVGWGDSIFLETWDEGGPHRFALIDSNDTATLRSSYIFLKRFFERSHATRNTPPYDPGKTILFDWVLLTHAHSDHAQGLKNILQEFGANRFWFPNTRKFQCGISPIPRRSAYIGSLLRFAQRSARVRQLDRIDNTTALPTFGSVQLLVLWPPANNDASEENNNSLVLSLSLGGVTFVLTGDAEADVWAGSQTQAGLSSQILPRTTFFKVPHHGASNGMFCAGYANSTWLAKLPHTTKLGISSHVQPFSHPDQSVIDAISSQGLACYRTDQHFHITISTDGSQTSVRYSH